MSHSHIIHPLVDDFKHHTQDHNCHNKNCHHPDHHCSPCSPSHKCQQGPSGPAGPEGRMGPEGPVGPVGPTGGPGPQGPMGIQGPQGEHGHHGHPGPPGHIGPWGPQGPEGPRGCPGKRGHRGPRGHRGKTGPFGPTGPQGPIGPNGSQGPQGPQGPNGIQGPIGPQGPQGPVGAQGPIGPTGIQGPQGPQGPVGAQGPIGIQGPQGPVGAQGPIGPSGIQGPQGPVGAQGPIGVQGPQGPVGAQGPIGPSGIQGPQGPVGAQGPIGIQGPQGPVGAQGPIGPSGIQGPQGPIGIQGPIGPIGIQGPQGPVGVQGPIGPIGIQGPQGPVGSQGPIGIQGPQGPVGIQGPIGPIGIQGPQGPVGIQGPQGPIGTQGPTGPIGIQGPVGTQGPIGPIGIQGPQGPVGIQGPQGPVGAQGPIGIQGPQGPNGAQGPIGPSGPIGIQGPQGPAGPTGPQGPAGISCYAYVWNDANQTVSACTTPPNIATQAVQFDHHYLNGITFDGVSTLTLQNNNMAYAAQYIITAIAPSNLPLISFKLLQNGTTIPGSIYYTGATPNSPEQLVGQVKFSGNSGDQIVLINNTDGAVQLDGTTPGSSGIVVGNHSYTDIKNVNTLATTSIAVSAGSSVYVFIQVGGSQTVTNVQDNQGNTFTLAISQNNGSLDTEVWYFDNVSVSAGYIITITVSGNANIAAEVVELQGTQTPSLASTGANSGHSLMPNVTLSNTSTQNMALMGVVTANAGSQSFTAVTPDILLDATAPGNPNNINIAGADLYEYLINMGATTLRANVTGHGTSAVDWASVGVVVAGTAAQSMCETPPVNASLDIFCLGPSTGSLAGVPNFKHPLPQPVHMNNRSGQRVEYETKSHSSSFSTASGTDSKKKKTLMGKLFGSPNKDTNKAVKKK